MTLFAPAVQAFFTTRLITQRAASPDTIASYRDAIRLLVQYASTRSGKAPSALDFADVDHKCVVEFLAHLAEQRGNSPATRNTRLAAIHSLFTASALAHPEHAADIALVLDIPGAKTVKREVVFLHDDEADALIAAPDTATKTGRRDRALWAVGIGTGMRISELISLTRADIDTTGKRPILTVIGKGRKQRSTPLIGLTAANHLGRWLEEIPHTPTVPVFPSRDGHPMSRDAIEARLRLSVLTAAEHCPSINAQSVTCHTLRHTCAMRLLGAGNDIATIALWLGHESIETTMIYLHADLALKHRALERIPADREIPKDPYKPHDDLLAFLQRL
jgi:site-specific recombinase XerD